MGHGKRPCAGENETAPGKIEFFQVGNGAWRIGNYMKTTASEVSCNPRKLYTEHYSHIDKCPIRLLIPDFFEQAIKITITLFEIISLTTVSTR
jgi:hypothetical protein